MALVIMRAAPGGPPEAAEVEPIPVVLVEPAPPEPPEPKAPEPKPKPEPAPKKTPPTPIKSRPPPIRARVAKAPAPPAVTPLPASDGPPDVGVALVGDAELAGAAAADSGAGSGCNMTRHLQGKLRKDRRVQAALSEAGRGKAIRIWNGGWVRHGVQEGAGLASVREAIQWEVGFAPEACREEPVRGLVVISLADGPGATRIVMGAGSWRWTDLLERRTRR
ncbi:hypothetical protein [Phenylobacterium sp.]|uniref:hypothetical protein n=1 Tax=Phenylobacterium sp. TaxID=1871053 RepID=UPI0026001AA2|nr:hypothetical protein [Phenylobacterium sp.]